MKKNKRNIIKNILGTGIIPVGTLIIVLAICMTRGVTLFQSEGSWIAFFRGVASVMLTTFALSINLNSGRFDFSIGSIALLSSVISSSISIDRGLPIGVMLFLSLFIGAILGALSGCIYILVKLPPIIISLGVTLLYEGAAFAFTRGYGVSFVTNIKLTSFPTVLNYLLVILISLCFTVLLFDYTKFGYDYKALLSGQKVAVNTGIKEKKNAVICYMLSGVLMGMVGFINATNTGTIQISLNFASIVVMFTAFLPMFIGGFISRFCNERIGYLMGAISTSFISLTYARLNVSSSIQQIITALILVIFLIYLNNEHVLKEVILGRRAIKDEV